MQLPGLFRKDATIELPCLAPWILELGQLLTIQSQKGSNLGWSQQQPGEFLYFL